MYKNLSANIYQTGDSSVFKLDTSVVEAPKAQQVLLKQTAIGVNFIDTYFRSGLYPVDLPATLGDEAVGIVEQVGQDVTEFSVGQRVAYSAAKGAYTQYRVIDINELVPVPESIDDKVVATSLLRGMTVEYLFCRLHELKPSDTILIHAAAGAWGKSPANGPALLGQRLSVPLALLKKPIWLNSMVVITSLTILSRISLRL